MIILMAAGAEPEIEHLINRRSRNHRSAKIASIAPWRSGFKKVGRQQVNKAMLDDEVKTRSWWVKSRSLELFTGGEEILHQ